MSDKCKNCDKPLEHKEGRRKKVFCDSDCRGQYFRKQKAVPKYVQIETHKNALLDLEQKLRSELLFSKPFTSTPIEGELGSNIIEYKAMTEESFDGKRFPKGYMADEAAQWDTSIVSKDKILSQIAAIEKETCPPERSRTEFTRKVWANDQKKRIEELKKQLH